MILMLHLGANICEELVLQAPLAAQACHPVWAGQHLAARNLKLSLLLAKGPHKMVLADPTVFMP